MVLLKRCDCLLFPHLDEVAKTVACTLQFPKNAFAFVTTLHCQNSKAPKMASTGTYSHYSGNIHSLPSSASNGLKFLAQFLKSVDALDDTSGALPLTELVAPSAMWIAGGADPQTTQDVQPMLSSRGKMLSAFSHTLLPVTAFHLVGEDGKHTLICESIST
jgi:hypothetical protein